MDIYGFRDEVAAGIERKTGYAYALRNMDSRKNNGIVLHGLYLSAQDSNVSPCIYMDDYFETYQQGDMGMDDIVDEVIRKYREHAVHTKCDTALFTDYDNVRAHIRARLVNTEKNRGLLRDIPHREILDLSLVYSADYPHGDEDGVAGIRITREHMTMWGVDEDTLYRQSRANMEGGKEWLLSGLTELVARLGDGEGQPDDAGHLPMYVLTNRWMINGAVQMLNPHALEEAAGILGNEVIILPSSVHEVMLLPAEGDGESLERLAQMVREINGTVVSPAEFLSDHIYRYSHDTGKLTIAA